MKLPFGVTLSTSGIKSAWNFVTGKKLPVETDYMNSVTDTMSNLPTADEARATYDALPGVDWTAPIEEAQKKCIAIFDAHCVLVAEYIRLWNEKKTQQ